MSTVYSLNMFHPIYFQFTSIKRRPWSRLSKIDAQLFPPFCFDGTLCAEMASTFLVSKMRTTME